VYRSNPAKLEALMIIASEGQFTLCANDVVQGNWISVYLLLEITVAYCHAFIALMEIGCFKNAESCLK
jgi:hypothetical protein